MNANPALPVAVDLDVQIASAATDLPDYDALLNWVSTALHDHQESASLTIRLVDDPESQQLNLDYRGKDAPTNVLSFPFDCPPDIDDPDIQALLGDLIICAPVVAREAADQGKPVLHHWAHMVVHGTLHLLGYDHIDPDEAEVMESLERRILARLDIADPY
ncbi:rRNA maturation RNase YbeY [Saccharospirillum impatiens]|uniref:rRNA maturation RNase YbeY n=1 Tax=Saccharospirillum impatiens TaxID=169438 RepID=UPI0003F5D1B1|nr:rRNA maturation RNase YbeY [Saccharospirillum impatiens]